MNEKRLCKSLDALMWFIDDSLGIDRKNDTLNGFDFIVPLLESAAYNSYLENVSNKADTIHLRLESSLISMMEHAYLNYIKRISDNISLPEKEVILAFDYTEEDFYGNVQGFDIHGWTGKDAITGHFKFLTCSIISDDIPVKIPLISVPIRLGHYKSSVILQCLYLIRNYVGKINLIMFDRGFYDKDLMYELEEIEYPYLIFVPKHKDKKEILYPMKIGEQIAVYNEFTVNKNQSKYCGENILVFLKQIYDPKNEKKYDWVFATNTEEVLLENIIVTYKKRWRIETQFRVQDEAKIRSKSKEMKVRFFFFLFEQMLQTIWICFYKDEVPFKEFVIELAKMSRKWTKTKED
jgi:Transposase DDE domain